MSVRPPATLECKEVVELVTEFLGETMPSDDRARLEQHLLVCPPCALHVDQVRSTLAHLRSLRADRGGAQADPTVVELFRRWKQTRARDDET